MSTISSTPASAQYTVGQPGVGRPIAVLKRWWLAYLTRRIEQEAITQLASMSNRELEDIGLTRLKIVGAVRGEAEDRLFKRYY